MVFVPQKSKEIRKQYLMAAKAVFAEIKSTKIKSVTANKDLTFRYTKEIVDDNSALLEFET